MQDRASELPRMHIRRSSQSPPSTHSGEYQPTTAKGPAFPVPESSQRKESESPTSTPGGGAPGGGRRTRIFRRDYCYTSGRRCMYRVVHSVLKHRLGATSVAAFITKRAALVRSQSTVRLCFVAGG